VSEIDCFFNVGLVIVIVMLVVHVAKT